MSLLVHHAAPPHLGQIRPLPSLSDCLSDRGVDSLLARAMALAKIGAWSCDLSNDGLSWTSGVYDIFGLPVGTPLDRRQTVEMYAEESREAMERLRARAIARCGTFTLDAQITRVDGAPRWKRLTGEMISRPGAAPLLHGVKQDITEDKLRWEAMRRLAENDPLTGLASRAIYESRFLNRPRSAAPIAPLGALILFDLDGFKGINDQYGHAAGDTCLRVFAERLSANFPEALLTARIGGDEFAMIVGHCELVDALPARVARFLARLRSPISWRGHIFTVSASTGIAAPHDPYRYDPEELFVRADARLYAAKRARRRAERAV